jgi:enoyl-CoA hydratase
MGQVEVRESGGLGWITLAEPDRRNALDMETAAKLKAAVAHLESSASVHVLIVTGSGTAFCAGADRQLLANANEAHLRAVYDSFLSIRDCKLPTIAAVNGPAVGAGLNLALACDVRIAAHSARFESRFMQLPIHPGGGHTWMLSRLVGPQTATAMAVFDQPLTGADAERLGLVWTCVPDERLIGECEQFAKRLIESPTPELGRIVKNTLVTNQLEPDFTRALERELTQQVESMSSPEYRARMGAR